MKRMYVEGQSRSEEGDMKRLKKYNVNYAVIMLR